MTEAVKSNNDLWISENDQVVLDGGPQSVQDALTDIDTESILQPMIVSNVGEQEQPAQVEAVVEPVAPPPVVDEEPEPQVYSYEDGSSVTIEKTKKGWEATLDSGTGAQPEVFKGATKDEMFARLAVGKINATKKIRQLSRQPSLSDEVPAPAPVKEAPVEPAVNRLTANDIFDIKAKLEENPDLAFETWFQKRTGMTPEALVGLTKAAASKSNTAEETSKDTAIAAALKDWVDITDDYHAVPENRDAMLSWLLKYKARVNPKTHTVDTALGYLYDNGLLTVENLDAAWEDLKADGAVVLPRAAEEDESPKPVAKTRPRPAAGLGIRSSEARATSRPTAEPAEVPVEQLTLAETEKLLNDIRRLKIQNPAEYERLKAIGEAKRRQG